MTAAKAVLDFSQSVIVDLSETAGLPALVKNAFRSGGASIPIIIFTDPGMTKIYGRYDHPAMKTQKYDTIFKDTKTGIRTALKNNEFNLGAGAPQIAKTNDAKVEIWLSAQGSTIKAKLIGIEDGKIFLFETEAGKTIRATAAQLSAESVKKARSLVK